MEIRDVILAPVFLLFLTVLMFLFRSSFTNSLTRSYFIKAFLIKMFGGLSFALVYQFYYGYGDTFMYHDAIKNLYETVLGNPSKAIEIFQGTAKEANDFFNSNRLVNRTFYLGEAEYMVVKFGFSLSLITFNSYLLLTFLFSTFSFLGLWAIFTVVTSIYPKITNQLVWGILYFPSMVFWSSSLLKDSIAIGAMGLSFYALYNLFIDRIRIFNIKAWVMLILCAPLLLAVKGYIIMLLIPTMIVWKYFRLQKVMGATAKILLTPVLIALGIFGIYFSLTNLVGEEDRFSADKIAYTASYQAYHLQKESMNGSYYEIGTFDGSIGSLIILGPKAIFIALFRPFIWETKNPVMLLAGLENLLVFYLFLAALWKLGIINYFRILFKSPFLIFSLIFVLAFALSVGLTSGNYGTLVRYKIPMLPFFSTLVLVLYNYDKITHESLKQ